MPDRYNLGEQSGVYALSDQKLLTKIMQDEFKDKSIKIKDIYTGNACKPGENYMSQVKLVQIEAAGKNDSTFEKKFIMKVQNEKDIKSQILYADRIWRNEEFVYETLLPKLESICKLSFDFPKYYYGDDTIILLENLKESGYTMGDRVQGLDFEHTLTVMDKLAKFHAASLSLKYNCPEDYKKLMSNYDHPFSSVECSDAVLPYIKLRMKNAIEMLEKNVVDQKRYSLLFQKLRNMMEEKIALKFERFDDLEDVVFTHGDLWGNNVMFVEKDGELDAAFLDFQGTRPGSAAKDILYFMYLSVEPLVRVQKFDRIIKHYHLKRNFYLKRFLNDDSGVDVNFSYSKFEKELLRFRYYGLINAALTLPMIVLDASKEKHEFFSTDNNNNQVVFRERFLNIVDEFIDKGWVEMKEDF